MQRYTNNYEDFRNFLEEYRVDRQKQHRFAISKQFVEIEMNCPEELQDFFDGSMQLTILGIEYLIVGYSVNYRACSLYLKKPVDVAEPRPKFKL